MTRHYHKNELHICFVFIFLTIGIFLCSKQQLVAQNIKGRPEVVKEVDNHQLDSLNKLAADSVKLAHKGALTQIIEYSAKDSVVYDFGEVDTLAFLYNEANVKSEEEKMEITANFFKINQRTLLFFATGVLDSTGQIAGKPVYKDNGAESSMDTLTYNYKTKKVRIINVIAKEGEGFLHSAITKRNPDGSTFIAKGKYTTCDHEHPHFYMHMTKGKIVGGDQKKVIFGPSYLVIEDVPFPLVLPFGFFPQLSDRSSGIKFPTYGEEVARGFFLENLGFYWAVGEYMDLDITGSIYSLGSWSIRSNSGYIKRYKFSGNFNLEYNYNVTGEKGSTDYMTNKTFSVRWNHRQDPKARPGTNFSANVNFSSVAADKYNNQHNPFQGVNNNASSSISYSKTWDGKPFNFSTNFTHSQNMRDSTYAITLPNFTFNVNRIYPFRSKSSVGKKKFYEDVSFTYGATFDNKVNFKSSEFGTPDFMKKMNNGLQHKFGLSLPSITLLKYINISPSVNYGMNWYFKTKEKHYDPTINQTIEDVSDAFSHFGVTQTYSFGASMDTRLYGMLQFKKGSRIEAIRHVVKPSIGFNYTPNQRTHANGWREYQSGPSINDIKEYNVYDNQAYSVPASMQSGSISFALGNTLEMKVLDSKDTTKANATKKISILDNLNISTSYNLLADSLNLSDINVSGSTNILGRLGLNFGARFNPYAIGDDGQKINTFYWKKKGGLRLAELRSFNMSFGYSFSGGNKGGSKGNVNPENNLTGVGGANIHGNGNMMEQEEIVQPVFSKDPFIYQDYYLPWTFTFSYTYGYNKNWRKINNALQAEKNHTQTLNFNGTISPTPNWSINFSSGLDMKSLKLAQTQVNISRNLHCFNFSFNWVPLGTWKSWSFRIAVTSSMLADFLKYDKRSSRWDNQ